VTAVEIPQAWVKVADDASALSLAHGYHFHGNSGRLVAELRTGAALPAESDYGVTLASGQTLYPDQLAALGPGALYARALGESTRLILR
jgi:hypothetical protein